MDVIFNLNILFKYKTTQVASWAGNVMVKQRHKFFPSDVCVVLAGLQATFNVYNGDTGTSEQYKLFGEDGLMNCDMKKRVSLF